MTDKDKNMKKVISYSLYGNIEKYTLGAIKNAEAIPIFYPGWEGWFYVGKSVPENIIKKLLSLKMKVIRINEEECSTSTMWRFLVFADKNVEYAIIRDTDSRLSERESKAVKEWINSGKSFHIMRDHPSHNTLILAGMWGAKAEKLRNIESLINNWDGEKTFSTDQTFLKKIIYPIAYSDCLIHADFYAIEPWAIPFSSKRLDYRFVGESFDENDTPDKSGLERMKFENYGKVRKGIYVTLQKLFNKKNKKNNRTGDIRVVHVSTSLSSVSAASRLIIAERLLGVDALALTNIKGKLNFPCYANTLTPKQKISKYVTSLYKKIKSKYCTFKKHSKKISNMPWNDGIFGEPIHNSTNNILNADITHLHWIASGFPAIKFLSKINTPIVWTLHDVWPLTSGHHCEMDCKVCMENGKGCKEFDKSDSKFPSSEYLWKYKKNFYSQIKDLTVITPSQWLGNMARKSPLFKERTVVVIPNCIDTNLFRPMDKITARNILKLPEGKKIILFSASGGIDLEYKGFALLVDALQKLKGGMNDENIHLLVVGSRDQGNFKLPFPATFLGNIDSESQLPTIYNSADIFVGPSRQDNFPNVFVEAMACGIPSVGFDVGGIPEIVKHKERGYIAKSFNTNDFAEGISWVLNDEARHATLSKNARTFAEENLSFGVVAKKHQELYQKILYKNNKSQ